MLSALKQVSVPAACITASYLVLAKAHQLAVPSASSHDVAAGAADKSASCSGRDRRETAHKFKLGRSLPLEKDNAYAFATDGVRYAVADANYSRILLYNSKPSELQRWKPDVILGVSVDQFRYQVGPCTASTLAIPTGVCIYNGSLIVCDRNNHRVLIWKTFPELYDSPADIVIGQLNFTDRYPNQSDGLNITPTACTLYSPTQCSVDADGNLFITDFDNYRVTGYRWPLWISTQFNLAATWVIGQDSFGQRLSGTQMRFEGPVDVVSNQRYMAVSDMNNGRVCIYKRSTVIAGRPKLAAVLGQTSIYHGHGMTSPDIPSRYCLTGPFGLLLTEKNALYVTDPLQGKVFVYPDIDSIVRSSSMKLLLAGQSVTAAVNQVFVKGSRFPSQVLANADGTFWIVEGLPNTNTIREVIRK